MRRQQPRLASRDPHAAHGAPRRGLARRFSNRRDAARHHEDKFFREEGAFWLLLVLALLLGGARAVLGLPNLAATLLPPGLMAAHARPEEPASRVTLALAGDFAPSRYSPQVLTPVPGNGFPAWLTERVEYAGLAQQQAAFVPVAHEAPAIAPVIAIVIDDLGDDVAAARRAIALPRNVSLAFLPYPDSTSVLAGEALRAGHQLLVHVPMEPEGKEDPGPMALTPALAAPEIVRRLNWDLSRVPGYSGINNHEGSKFTADRAALVPVIEALAAAHVFFLDSRTTPNSQIVALSRSFGVASAARDIFLDDVETRAGVDAQLAQTEKLAREQGTAIAIGHPHAVTLDALTAWAAHVQARGFQLVPVNVAIRMKTEKEIRQLSATK